MFDMTIRAVSFGFAMIGITRKHIQMTGLAFLVIHRPPGIMTARAFGIDAGMIENERPALKRRVAFKTICKSRKSQGRHDTQKNDISNKKRTPLA